MTTLTHIATSYVIPPVKMITAGAVLSAAYGWYRNISLIQCIKAGSVCGLCIHVFETVSIACAKKLPALAQKRKWKASTVLSIEMTRVAFHAIVYTTALLALGVISKNVHLTATVGELMLYTFGLGYARAIRHSQNDAILHKRFSYNDWHAAYQKATSHD